MQNPEFVQIFNNGEPRISTEKIAKRYLVPDTAIIQLVRLYLPQLETFGVIAFETRLNPGGKRTEYAILNERQAGFLISLLCNTAEVVDFKLRLLHELWRMAQALENRDMTVLQRRLKLEALTRALALASLGSKLMLDREGVLLGIKIECQRLKAVVEPGFAFDSSETVH